jgi:hypothetical protein
MAMRGAIASPAVPGIEGIITLNIMTLNRGTPDESLPPMVLQDKFLEKGARE